MKIFFHFFQFNFFVENGDLFFNNIIMLLIMVFITSIKHSSNIQIFRFHLDQVL